MLTSTHQLTERQLKDLEKLAALCRKKDNSIPNLYTHILAKVRTVPAATLFYDKKNLIGFLSIFFFYDEAVEVALMISPKTRKLGIAKKLLRHIIPLLQAYNYPKLIFSSPSHLNDKWLTRMGFTFLHSEYHMKREDLNPLLDYKQKLLIRPPTDKDIPHLIHLDEVCFAKKQAESFERFRNLLDDRTYQLFVIVQDNAVIGKAQIRWDAKGATLSDIAILPKLQGKGLGTALITHCINFALSEGKPNISLDVETKNQRALHLYTRLGFLTQNACDYWSIGINELKGLVG